MNSRSWEETDGGKLLRKWFQSSCEINASSAGSSSAHFAIKSGLITVLRPNLIRIEGPGEDGICAEMDLSDDVIFEDVASAEIFKSIPALKGRVYGEQLLMSAHSETWFLTGPAEIEGE